MTILISIGKWGNIYYYLGYGFRLCLGWVAITFLPCDGDIILDMAVKEAERLVSAKKSKGNEPK